MARRKPQAKPQEQTEEIKRDRIYEPKEVEIGYEFILRLVSYRFERSEPRPSDKNARQERFKNDKDRIAQQMGYDSYVVLPRDAKSFESRCSSIQKHRKDMSYSDVAKAERLYNQKLSDVLHDSVMEELSFHVSQFTSDERRYNLMRRMCNYTIPFVFKPRSNP